MLASLDGAIAPIAETSIPVTDEGLLRGDGAFEGARLYSGRPFAIDDHYARLQRTCNGLRLEFDLTALRAEEDALLEEAGTLGAQLRHVHTSGWSGVSRASWARRPSGRGPADLPLHVPGDVACGREDALYGSAHGLDQH